MAKSTPTRRQREALAKQKRHGQGMREWLQLLRESYMPKEPVEVVPSGHGLTRVMRAIEVREPETFWDSAEHGQFVRETAKDNPKASRRLRQELRGAE